MKNLAKISVLMLVFVGLVLFTSCDNTPTKQFSSDASLNSLSVALNKDGNSILTGFTSATLEYAITLSTGTTKVYVNSVAKEKGAKIAYLPARDTDGGITLPTNNKVTVTVTAPNVKTTKTYILNFAFPPVLSTDASLQNLSVATTKGGTNLLTSFTSATLTYSVTLPTRTTKVFVTATPIQSKASVTYSPVAGTDGGIVLTANNQVTVTVTAPDGKTTKTYILNFSITPNPVLDASLKSLSVATTSGGPNLFTSFTSTTLSYSITLPTGTTKVFLTATANAAGASVTYLPVAGTDGGIALPDYNNQVTVTVKATDNNTTKTYILNFSITPAQSTDASLKSLSVAITSGGANLLTGFTSATLSYSVTLPTGTTKVFVTATPNATGASITYLPAAGTDGGINLLTNNQVTVTVKATDNKTTKAYTVTVTK